MSEAAPVPPVVTVGDVVRWNAADEYHRYELSVEGVLSVAPVPSGEHARIASDVMFWLGDSITPRNRVRQSMGIWVTAAGKAGYRVPDLVVLRDDEADEGNVDGSLVLLAVEIASDSTEHVDLGAKVREFALAGVEHYWTITQAAHPMVVRRRLGADGRYETLPAQPLSWMLAHADPAALL